MDTMPGKQQTLFERVGGEQAIAELIHDLAFIKSPISQQRPLFSILGK